MSDRVNDPDITKQIQDLQDRIYQLELDRVAGSNIVLPEDAQQGVVSGGTVTRNSASQVTVAAGVGYFTLPSGLLLRVVWPQTIFNITAGPTNGRVDQVVVDINGTVSILTGSTPSTAIPSGASVALDSAQATSSRVKLPSNAIRLHEFVVWSSGVSNNLGTEFRDRRVSAKGIDFVATRVGDTAAIGTTITDIGGSMRQRLELTSASPIEVEWNGFAYGKLNAYVYIYFRFDTVGGASEYRVGIEKLIGGLGTEVSAQGSKVIPAGTTAGSYLLNVRAAVSSGVVYVRHGDLRVRQKPGMSTEANGPA